MLPGERLRAAFLRWNRLGLAGLLLLPLGLSTVLGFLWLHERGWLLWFVLGTVGLVVAVRVARLALRLRRPAEPAPRTIEATAIDPDWNAREQEIYARAQAFIAERLPAPLPWQELPAEALAVVELVAAELSGGKRSALDFTLPEALLLIDRVSLRYREFLRRHMPFSDQLSVRALYWIWRRQDQALVAWETGFLAWRGVRLVLNPAVGLMREVERAVTAGLHDRLSDHFLRDAQAILLEEAAQAAVDLYSGRLRFTDSELARISPEADLRDHQRLALPDEPLRLMVVGQVSAGKSTLINALLGTEAAETDMAATTDRVNVHEGAIDGVPCNFIDTPGLDGGQDSAQAGAQTLPPALLDDLAEADMIVWVVRASRPARAADRALRAALDARLAALPLRRRAPIIHVASAADTLLPGWPYAENRLPRDAQNRVGQAMAAIAADLGTDSVIPVCAVAPEWNLDTLGEALAAAIPEALMTQRNRRRLAAERQGDGLRQNLARAGRGLGKGARLLGKRLMRRSP
ncbi:MAG: GTPase [Pararhodobacter sp.]